MALNDLTVPAGDANEFQRLLDTLYTRYQDDIENLTDAATDEIETAIRRGDLDLKEIVREYTDSASQLSRDYYHTVRQAWQEYTGEQFPGFDDGGLVDADRVLWQTQHGFANTDYAGVKYSDVKAGSNKADLTMDDLWPAMTDIDDAQQFIADMIRNALRSQTQQCMRRDPTQPRWARVPQGRTCAFCLMLASRGFAYLSAETAGKGGARFHSDCDCRIIPSWGRQTLAGYDVQQLEKTYSKAKEYAKKHGISPLQALRQQRGITTDGRIPAELQLPPGRPPADPDGGGVFRRFLGDRSVYEALTGTNPNYEDGIEWQTNCQRCVVAYEMRRRGYNVTANPRELDAHGAIKTEPLTYQWYKAFMASRVRCPIGSGLDDVLRKMDEWGLSSRAIVQITWSATGTSHVFIAENLKNGVQFFDPQTGDWDVKRYFNAAADGKSSIMRIDDAHAVKSIVFRLCREV